MEAAKDGVHKIDWERAMIILSMMVMEGFGFVMLVCGILGIKIF